MTTASTSPFAELNKSTANSFNEQKNLIKRVLKGQATQCKHCPSPLTLKLPDASKTEQIGRIYCSKGCTDIELDMEAVTAK